MSTQPHELGQAPQPASRERLPVERQSINHKFTIGDQKFYLIVGMYKNGQPGEMFLRADRTGSTMSGMLDGVSVAVSVALQHGVPLSVFVDKFSHTRFEPDGFTGNPEIPIAKSVLDYAFRWLGAKFPREKMQ
jgi:ribonucleoside-diphosphate reductase alpha chain